jgi:AcrR family transcriptional regulator
LRNAFAQRSDCIVALPVANFRTSQVSRRELTSKSAIDSMVSNRLCYRLVSQLQGATPPPRKTIVNTPLAKTEPRWERRKDARPAELAFAALELFAEKGFAATRLEDVAARAGVSKGTLYLYFDSKEALFKEVVSGSIVPAMIEAEKMLAQHTGSAAELLETIVWEWWHRILATPLGGIPKLMLAEARNFPEIADFYYEEVIRRGTNLVRAAIRRGIASGEFRPLDADYAVHLFMAPMIMLGVSRHSVDFCGRENRDPLQYVRTHLELALAGLRHYGEATQHDRHRLRSAPAAAKPTARAAPARARRPNKRNRKA